MNWAAEKRFSGSSETLWDDRKKIEKDRNSITVPLAKWSVWERLKIAINWTVVTEKILIAD